MPDGLDRLKVLINSSTPIIVMETSEEMRAVNAVRTACSSLNMETFEWSIAERRHRSGSSVAVESQASPLQPRNAQTNVWNQARVPQARTSLSPGSGESDRLTRAM